MLTDNPDELDHRAAGLAPRGLWEWMHLDTNKRSMGATSELSNSFVLRPCFLKHVPAPINDAVAL